MTTAKSSALTDQQAGTIQDARLIKARVRSAIDTIAVLTTDIDAADILLYAIDLPSNAHGIDIDVYNDDLDSNCCPTLTVDIGLYAAQDFTSDTSGTLTKHLEDAALDIDVFVDNSTVLQAATTGYTRQALDSATYGPDDVLKPLWELLGYAVDPKVKFRVAMTIGTVAATAVAGDISMRVRYQLD